MGRKIAVLMGGISAERNISLETGKAIARGLGELGHQVVEIDVDSDLPLALSREEPEVAFIALHGRGGEDGSVQGLLEVMRIPYTGSGVLSSAMTMDKVVTKKILRFHDVPVVDDVVIDRGGSYREAALAVSDELDYPVMVKPSNEGSSIAVTEVREPEGLKAALEQVFERDSRVLVERFVHGRLLTVGLLGPEPTILPVLEIMPREGFYDYRAKYEQGLTEYEVPANISSEIAGSARKISLNVFDFLECDDIARVDLMLEEQTDRLLVLEINTMPGMTATSLIPKAAEAAGLTFHDVLATVLAGTRLKIDL